MKHEIEQIWFKIEQLLIEIYVYIEAHPSLSISYWIMVLED